MTNNKQPESQKKTLDPDLEQWIFYLSSIEQSSLHTIRAYRREVHELYTFCEKPLRELVKKDIQSYIRHCAQKNLKPATIRRKIAALSSFYKRLIHLEIIKKNPTVSLSLPRLPQSLPKSISQESAKKLVENPIQEGDYYIRNRAILECLYGGGLRVSELCQLNREHLTIKDGKMTLSVIGKGNKPRNVFLPRLAFLALQELFKTTHYEPKSPLFQNCYGNRLSQNAVYKICRKSGKKNEISQRVHPHVMRHSYATHLLHKGADIRRIQEFLGHKSVETSKIYLKNTTDRLSGSYAQSHKQIKDAVKKSKSTNYSTEQNTKHKILENKKET